MVFSLGVIITVQNAFITSFDFLQPFSLPLQEIWSFVMQARKA